MNYKIDNLQYCNWSREIFEINREAELDAVHVTIVYHEDYDELLKRVDEWNIHFKDNSDLIFHGKSYKDIEKAKEQKKNKDIAKLLNIDYWTTIVVYKDNKELAREIGLYNEKDIYNLIKKGI